MGLTGRCLCGQASYEVEGRPLATAVCHCRNCQRQAGTAFSVIVAVPSDAVSLTGELKTFHDEADSGRVLQRKFCPECGSPLFSVAADDPGTTFVKAGTLDDVADIRPEFQVWCASAQPWVDIDRTLPCFDRNPPVPG